MRRSDGIDDLVAGFVNSVSDAILKEVRARADAVLEWGAGQRATNGVRRAQARPISAGRRLQGVYLGKLRKLEGRKRTRVRTLARTQGVPAAIALADRLLGGRK